MAVITYFFDNPKPGEQIDVDNIPKLILDALKGLVYSDDSQVSDVLCRVRDRNRNLRVSNASPVLLEALERRGPLVHVVVTNALSEEVEY